MKIESKDTNILKLFTSDFLKIPRFQRPYSWDDENLEEFWNDVVQNKDGDYFIGSMVVFESSSEEYGVVDGQQRLTTITILLCAIRNAFEEIGYNDLAKGLHAKIERGDIDSVNRYVVMTETSYPFFAEEIQKFGEKDFTTEPGREEARIKSAFDFFKSKVGSILEAVEIDGTIPKEDKLEAKASRLKKLRDAVLGLSLIRIELDNEDDAYLIFETLNTRGKDLALTDLLKNHFFKTIKGKGSVDSAKELWKAMLSKLGSSDAEIDPDLFFVHSWSSKFEATTQQKAYKKIKTVVDSPNARTYLKGFVSDASHYISIFDPNQGWNKSQRSVIDSLEAMRIFKISQHTPGVLSLVRSFNDGMISEKTLKRALKAIENFHFLFTAVTSSRSSGGISAMYSSFGRKIFESKDANEAGVVINELIEKLDERKPSITEFMASFEQIYFTRTNTKQSSLVRYILKHFSNHQNLKFSDDMSNLSIEHIHPQSSINDDWPSETVGMLGNLILLTKSDNTELRDFDFQRKLAYFREIEASIPSDVLAKTDWTQTEVRQRTAALGKMAYDEIWKIKA